MIAHLLSLEGASTKSRIGCGYDAWILKNGLKYSVVSYSILHFFVYNSCLRHIHCVSLLYPHVFGHHTLQHQIPSLRAQ